MVHFDGCLYNREALLPQLGLNTNATDLQIVEQAYLKWNIDAPKHLTGAFAFAVINNEEIFLARDPLGVKRVFYCADNPLAHAFEIKDLPAKPRLGREGIAQLLLLGPGRVPGSGIFDNVLELKPGCWLKHSPASGTQGGAYWRPKAEPHPHTLDETVAHVRSRVREVIRQSAQSEKKVCAFLSGGLDSSAIAALSGVRETFSVDYADNAAHFKKSKFQPDDDRAYIECMTQYLETRHTTFTLDTHPLAEALCEAVQARGFPGMGDVDTSLLLFCREVKKHADLALSGEGADEIFGGYPWYRDEKRLWESTFPWSQSVSYRAGFAQDGVWDGLDPQAFVRSHYEDALAQADTLSSDTPHEKRMRQMFMLNLHWFGQTLLERHDRMSRFVGLEVRMPFCDAALVQYLYNVPWPYKNFKQREKGLLREALQGWLPDKVLWRKKSPYPKTHHPAYWLAVSDKMRQLSPNAPLFDIVSRRAVFSLLDGDDHNPPWYGQLMTQPQTVAYFLQMNHWLEYNRVDVN